MTTLADSVPPLFWPAVEKLDELNRTMGLGVPPIKTMLERIAIFDPDEIRRIAAVWGADGASGLPGSNASTLAEATGVIVAKVDDRWEGDAFTAFDSAMHEARDLIGRIAEPARQIGDQLWDFADLMERSWAEVVGTVATVAGAILAVGTIGTGVLAVIGVVVSLIGLICVVIGEVNRALAKNTTLDRLQGELHDKIPGVDESPIPLPDRGDWEKKTENPND